MMMPMNEDQPERVEASDPASERAEPVVGGERRSARSLDQHGRAELSVRSVLGGDTRAARRRRARRSRGRAPQRGRSAHCSREAREPAGTIDIGTVQTTVEFALLIGRIDVTYYCI